MFAIQSVCCYGRVRRQSAPSEPRGSLFETIFGTGIDKEKDPEDDARHGMTVQKKLAVLRRESRTMSSCPTSPMSREEAEALAALGPGVHAVAVDAASSAPRRTSLGVKSRDEKRISTASTASGTSSAAALRRSGDLLAETDGAAAPEAAGDQAVGAGEPDSDGEKEEEEEEEEAAQQAEAAPACSAADEVGEQLNDKAALDDAAELPTSAHDESPSNAQDSISISSDLSPRSRQSNSYDEEDPTAANKEHEPDAVYTTVPEVTVTSMTSVRRMTSQFSNRTSLQESQRMPASSPSRSAAMMSRRTSRQLRKSTLRVDYKPEPLSPTAAQREDGAEEEEVPPS
eukprot:TRINITY_DN6094_c0_g1_i1.p1 TRINITY_DN6094_c0_g1~~TRINITY_DN6094_c0_g1_i1.p1  ORF type:complete len:343 (-),score=92.44 TRINITY_DN6094_c0_g1_i1:193-1221(-)